jgi:hypothetical protein
MKMDIAGGHFTDTKILQEPMTWPLWLGVEWRKFRIEVRDSTKVTTARFDLIDQGLERIEFQVSRKELRMLLYRSPLN